MVSVRSNSRAVDTQKLAATAQGNVAEVNLSMSQRRPFKAQSQHLQPGFMPSQVTNVDFGSICNLVRHRRWSQPSRRHAWLIWKELNAVQVASLRNVPDTQRICQNMQT